MSLRATVIGGLRLTTASYGVVAIVNFGKTIVLARVLAPADFGLAAIVMAVLALMQTFGDAGIGAAIVQRESITRAELTSFFWVSIAVAGAMAGAYALCVPGIARFFGHADLRPLLLMSAAIPVIRSPGLQYQMLLQRNLRFQVLAAIDLVAGVMNAVSAVIAAMAGFGAASIILGQIVSAIIRTVACAYFGATFFRPSLSWNAADAKGIVSFGLFQLGDRLVRTLATRIDQLVIGKVLGTVDLGYYNLAYNLVVQPLSRLAPILGRVMFPVYARMQQDRPRLKRAYFEVLQGLSLVLFPIMIFLAFFAASVIPILYGAEWAPAITAVRLLAIAGVFWTIDYPIEALQVSVGQVRRSFLWSFVVLILTGSSVALGTHWGLVGVAGAVLGAWGGLYVLEYVGIVKPILGPEPRLYFVSSMLWPATLAGASASLATLMTDASHFRFVWSQVALGGTVFCITYCGLTVWRYRKMTVGLWSAVTGRLQPVAR